MKKKLKEVKLSHEFNSKTLKTLLNRYYLQRILDFVKNGTKFDVFFAIKLNLPASCKD